jgi:hypothetical protein
MSDDDWATTAEATIARDRALLRHIVATLAYRGAKPLRDAPSGFGDFLAPGVKNRPRVLLSHVGDLVVWARRWVETGDEETFAIAEPGTWEEEIVRFHLALEALDQTLAAAPGPFPTERLFQAPLADAFTHVGQLALLRRLAGAPVLGESYRKADIVAGRVGTAQPAPGREFALDKGAIWRAD